jgi:hypothetical protein
MQEKLFRRDLKHVLETLEKLILGKADHTDYVKAYEYFIKTWCPKDNMD